MARMMRHRAIPLLIAVSVVLTLGGTGLGQGLSSAVADPAPQPIRVLAGRDYATTTFNDPWDYSNPSDLLLDDGPTRGLTAPKMSGGMVSFTSHAGYLSPLWGGYSMEVPVEREGTRAGNSLNANTYTRMHLHAYVSSVSSVVLSWYTCGALRSACMGYTNFTLVAGWNDIDVPIVRRGGTQAWAGNMVGLMMGLGVSHGVAQFHLDSLRFYQPLSASIRWAAPAASASTLWWTDIPGTITALAGQHSGRVANAAGSANSSVGVNANVAGYAPGTTFWSVAADGTKTLVGVSSPAPLPVVDSPSAIGCGDYATRYLGHPWTFTSMRSLLTHENMTAISFSKAGELSATNAGPVRSDPAFRLPIGPAGIDGRLYHRMTIVESYDGPFGLTPTPGAGAMGRVLWTTVGHTAWAQSAPLVTFSGKRSLTFDLAMPALQLTDPTGLATQRYAFSSASAVNRVRYDPNEDPGAKRWHVFSIQLAADCQAAPYANITWHDAAYSAGSTMQLHVTAANGATYALASGTEHAGLNSRTVSLAGVPRGRYSVVVYITNAAHVTTTARSTGPLVKH